MAFIQKINERLTLQKIDYLYFLTDIFASTFLTYIFHNILYTRKQNPTQLDFWAFAILVISIILFSIGLISNRKGYFNKTNVHYPIWNVNYLYYFANSVAILIFLGMSFPYPKKLSREIIWIFVGIVFLIFWNWMHNKVNNELTGDTSGRPDFKTNRKWTYFLLFPFVAVSAVFGSYLSSGIGTYEIILSYSPGFARSFSLVFIVAGMTFYSYMVIMPARQLITAIRGEKWNKSFLFFWLLTLTNLIRLIININLN